LLATINSDENLRHNNYYPDFELISQLKIPLPSSLYIIVVMRGSSPVPQPCNLSISGLVEKLTSLFQILLKLLE
jgi:hypothetical protein